MLTAHDTTAGETTAGETTAEDTADCIEGEDADEEVLQIESGVLDPESTYLSQRTIRFYGHD